MIQNEIVKLACINTECEMEQTLILQFMNILTKEALVYELGNELVDAFLAAEEDHKKFKLLQKQNDKNIDQILDLLQSNKKLNQK